MVLTRRAMLTSTFLVGAGCAAEAPSTLHTIRLRPRMSEGEFRAAAGDRLRPDDTLQMSAFRRPYRLIYECCESPLVIIDADDRHADTMFTSPRYGVAFTVLHSYLSADMAVGETERLYAALTAAQYRDRSRPFRVSVLGRAPAALADAAAAAIALREAAPDRHYRILAYDLEHADGRVASAEILPSAAPLFAPQRRFALQLYFADDVASDRRP